MSNGKRRVRGIGTCVAITNQVSTDLEEICHAALTFSSINCYLFIGFNFKFLTFFFRCSSLLSNSSTVRRLLHRLHARQATRRHPHALCPHSPPLISHCVLLPPLIQSFSHVTHQNKQHVYLYTHHGAPHSFRSRQRCHHLRAARWRASRGGELRGRSRNCAQHPRRHRGRYEGIPRAWRRWHCRRSRGRRVGCRSHRLGLGEWCGFNAWQSSGESERERGRSSKHCTVASLPLPTSLTVAPTLRVRERCCGSALRADVLRAADSARARARLFSSVHPRSLLSPARSSLTTKSLLSSPRPPLQ